MRLTRFGNRKARLAVVTLWLATTGCKSLPYIDQSKSVPHDVAAPVAELDQELRQAAFMSELPTQLPQIDPPRTVDNPEAKEPWEMTLQEAIELALDNGEVIRVISLGAQGIPVEGFAPTQLNNQAGAALGAGTLASVYDPAIQETQIASALSVFDAQLSTQFFFESRDFLVNNSIQAGFLDADTAVPALVRQRGAPQGLPSFQTALTKRLATGGQVGITNRVNYLFGNSPIQTFPSAYTTELALQFTQPLLGGNDQNGPSGLEANRAGIVIARLNADTSVWRFKAEVMAMVRSVEQQYWALAQQQIQYWSRLQAVLLGETIYEQELAKLEVGTGSRPDVAEAEQNLRNFQLDLIQAQSDLITTERQFRELLGLPPSDNRRIIPVTAPTTARLEPDWETSLKQMMSYHPDIIQQQLLVRVAELQLLLARNQLLPSLDLDLLYQFNGLGQDLDDSFAVMTGKSVLAIDPINSQQQQQAGVNPQPAFFDNFQTWRVGLTFSMPIGFRGPLADQRQAQHALLRQRAFLQQVVHQTVHGLHRFFVEVDSNYKLMKYAELAVDAAKERLESQREFYAAGTINIDRYLEAVNQWSNSVARLAQFRTAYNTSIAALEEAKGTLLAYNNVVVAEGPQPKKAYIQAFDQQRAHRRIPIPHDGPASPRPRVKPPVSDPVRPRPTPGTEAPQPDPNYPAPFGTRGMPAPPVAPTVPTGDPTPLSSNGPKAPASTPTPLDPAVAPADLEAPVGNALPTGSLSSPSSSLSPSRSSNAKPGTSAASARLRLPELPGFRSGTRSKPDTSRSAPMPSGSSLPPLPDRALPATGSSGRSRALPSTPPIELPPLPD